MWGGRGVAASEVLAVELGGIVFVFFVIGGGAGGGGEAGAGSMWGLNAVGILTNIKRQLVCANRVVVCARVR